MVSYNIDEKRNVRLVGRSRDMEEIVNAHSKNRDNGEGTQYVRRLTVSILRARRSTPSGLTLLRQVNETGWEGC